MVGSDEPPGRSGGARRSAGDPLSTRSLPAAALPKSSRLRRYLMRGVTTTGFALVIATVLWILMRQPYTTTLIYTLCISLCCWFLIDTGRIAAALWGQRNAAGGARDESLWPGWRTTVPIVVVGSVLGYAIGNEIANALLGRNVPGPFNASLEQTLTVLVLAIVPGVVITFVFHSRETIAAQEALMQQAERQAAEQQLKLLESQLEPHMLFNTLANLRALIGVDPARAQAMLDRLIAFLRASLAGSRASRHSIEDEFARLADYLALLQIRMGGRLQTRFEIGAGAAAAQVPALLLQPLVENSIKHGLEPQVAGGRVEVGANRDGDALVIRVRDTGVGPRFDGAEPAGFGLGHVRERLATLYGDAASFSFEPAPGAEGGAIATVRLPFETSRPQP